MRTVRDNYFIITGHTYDEYLKKYRHGVGKGKLLVFTENEINCLKKHTFYWEVIGPEGNVLYCQVHRIKKKHIIIPLTIAILIAGGTCAGIYVPKYLNNFTGEVTNEQWQDAMENIVNIKENRVLNYTTKSKFSLKDVASDIDLEINDLLVDGNYEEAIDADGTRKMYMQNYKHLPIKYVENLKDPSESFLSTWKCMTKDYIATPFGDFYTTKDSFQFDKNTKTYSYSTDELGEGITKLKDVKASIKFESRNSIKNVTCSYTIYVGEYAGATFNGEFEYTYGNAKHTEWSQDFQKVLEARTFSYYDDDKGLLSLSDDQTYLYSKDNSFTKESYGDRQAFIINLDFTDAASSKLPQNLKYFKLVDANKSAINNWCINIEIFKNDEKLEEYVDWKYTYDENKKHILGFELTNLPTKNDVISMKLAINKYAFVEDSRLVITPSEAII